MDPKVKQYKAELQQLVDFIEGRGDAEELDVALNSSQMQELLSIYEDKKYPASTNFYRKLSRQDRVSLGGLVNTEGIIIQFLERTGVAFTSTEKYGKIYELILDALPKYLDPPLEYLMKYVVPTDESMSNTKKKKIIKERLKAQFKYTSKPPRWVQEADWPIVNGRPLVFVGQLPIDIPEVFHDSGDVFVFYNTEAGDYQTIEQFG